MNTRVAIGVVAIILIALGAYFIYNEQREPDRETIDTLVAEYGREYEPGRIETISVEQMGDIYRVSGEIVEVSTHAGDPEEISRRPITLTIAKTDKRLEIIDAELGVYPGDGNWIYSPISSEGTRFLYPEKLPTTYITATTLPPEVSYTAGDLSCSERDEIMIGDRTYCKTVETEGAAGSTYRTYRYITSQGDFLANIKFTLRFPQCENYDEPKRSECKSEQTSYDIDGLADRIASSIQMH